MTALLRTLCNPRNDVCKRTPRQRSMSTTGGKRTYGISSEEKRKGRADIVAPRIKSGADASEKGEAIQLQVITSKPTEGQ